MRIALLTLLLAACASGPTLSQSSGVVRQLILENPTNTHVLVRVHCEEANMGGSVDEHDFLLHPYAVVAAPVSGVAAGQRCYIVGVAPMGPKELCAGGSK